MCILSTDTHDAAELWKVTRITSKVNRRLGSAPGLVPAPLQEQRYTLASANPTVIVIRLNIAAVILSNVQWWGVGGGMVHGLRYTLKIVFVGVFLCLTGSLKSQRVLFFNRFSFYVPCNSSFTTAVGGRINIGRSPDKGRKICFLLALCCLMSLFSFIFLSVSPPITKIQD